LPHQYPEPANKISLWAILLTFLKVGTLTFGGGFAMLPIIYRETVERNNWVDNQTFSDILIITQSMPGQIALNSSIQVGIRLRGTVGGLVAALGVTLPSVLILMAIAAYFYPQFKDNVYVEAAFYGLRPAVVALIAASAVRIGRQILLGWNGVILCAVLLITAIITNVHPILIMVAGGLAGLVICKGTNRR